MAERGNFRHEGFKAHESLRLLDGLEGVERLSEKQQLMVRASMLVQERAERGGDLLGELAINSPQTHVTDEFKILASTDLMHYYHQGAPHPDTRAYAASQNNVADWNCHASVAALELEESSFETVTELPEDFFETEFLRSGDFADVEERVRSIGFPCVVQVSRDNSSTDDYGKYHSVVVVGEKDGVLFSWEKAGYGDRYQIQELEKVYDLYQGEKYSFVDFYWGVKALHEGTKNDFVDVYPSS